MTLFHQKSLNTVHQVCFSVGRLPTLKIPASYDDILVTGIGNADDGISTSDLSNSSYPGDVTTSSYPGDVTTGSYPGDVTTSSYPGDVTTSSYPGDFSDNSASVCYEPYTTFTDSYRRESVSSSGKCDMYEVDGTSWYRFQLETGENGILDHCPLIWTCGSSWPMWMNDTHPEDYGEIKQVTVGASSKGHPWYGDTCFAESGTVMVTKCGVDGDIFYLYQLWRPDRCALAYCTRTYDIP